MSRATQTITVFDEGGRETITVMTDRGRERDIPLLDPNDPAERDNVATDRFDLPEGFGYRLAGKGILRRLVGPSGRLLTDWHSEIAVVEPGRAIVQVALHDETVRWQPDLRELDAWERSPTNTISDYLSPQNDR